MAEFIAFSSLSWHERSTGVALAVLVDQRRQGSREMLVELCRLGRGGTMEVAVPAGSDEYLFTLAGDVGLAGPDGHHALGPGVFASLREAERYTLAGSGDDEGLVLSVVAPPPGTRRDLPGARGGTLVTRVVDLPVVDERESGKRRVYLVTEGTTGSKRAHGMIVAYRGDTVTPNHFHPDAESLFVFLEGKGIVLVDNREIVVGPGQAAYFGRGDRHALRSAGAEGMRFLEFHIPGAYQVVRV